MTNEPTVQVDVIQWFKEHLPCFEAVGKDFYSLTAEEKGSKYWSELKTVLKDTFLLDMIFIDFDPTVLAFSFSYRSKLFRVVMPKGTVHLQEVDDKPEVTKSTLSIMDKMQVILAEKAELNLQYKNGMISKPEYLLGHQVANLRIIELATASNTKIHSELANLLGTESVAKALYEVIYTPQQGIKNCKKSLTLR